MKTAASKQLVSYGVLLYRQRNQQHHAEWEYLLGKIPQGNFWTAFKGLSEPGETPHETAIREFAEETGTSDVLTSLQPVSTLHGKAGKKQIVLFLQDGSHISPDCFDIEKVVKIDQGYLEGRPEIIAIQWMTRQQALEGNDGARIYPSQEEMLQQAETYLTRHLGHGSSSE